ncbi:stability determinant [Sphingomonadaceae bacterium OTU29MARTA1]|nr:stability determinant [Sphingomonadaceae bacterium OTU29MARTA1]
MADLTPIESEFATSEDAAAYDAWFRAKVERAMASTAQRIPHDEVMAMSRAVIDRHRSK